LLQGPEEQGIVPLSQFADGALVRVELQFPAGAQIQVGPGPLPHLGSILHHHIFFGIEFYIPDLVELELFDVEDEKAFLEAHAGNPLLGQNLSPHQDKTVISFGPGGDFVGIDGDGRGFLGGVEGQPYHFLLGGDPREDDNTRGNGRDQPSAGQHTEDDEPSCAEKFHHDTSGKTGPPTPAPGIAR
jgi:hypothetical protein